MKNLIITVASLFTFQSFAQIAAFNHIRIERKDGKIFVAGPKCDFLNKEAKAMAQWSQKLKEKTKESSCSCPGDGTYCYKDITDIAPDFVVAHHDKRAQVMGPNSFNAALQSSKILTQARYTSGTEMNFWMNSPLCRERGANEPLSPGDLGLIRNKKDGDVHGFVHVTENLAFSKNNFQTNQPYALQLPEEIFDHHNVPKECRKISGIPAQCSSWINFFSCKTLDEYIKEKPIKSQDAKKAFEQLSDIECSIGEAVVNGKSNPTLRSFVVDNLVILNNMAFDVIKGKKFLQEDKVIWQAIFHRTKSLSGQMDYLP